MSSLPNINLVLINSTSALVGLEKDCLHSLIYFAMISLNVFLCSGVIAANTVMVQTRLAGIHIRKSTFLSIHYISNLLKTEMPLTKIATNIINIVIIAISFLTVCVF